MMYTPHIANLELWKTSGHCDFYADDMFNNTKFYDLIICADVFEHVEDYYGFLEKISKKAKYILFNIPLDINLLFGMILRRYSTAPFICIHAVLVVDRHSLLFQSEVGYPSFLHCLLASRWVCR